jgi:hypothetical protein
MHLHGVEELGDDGGDAAEERRPAAALHLVAVAGHLDERPALVRDGLRDPGRVHLAHRRREDGRRAAHRVSASGHGHGERVEQRKVARERAGVRREVLVRRELRRVDEDGEDREVVRPQAALHCGVAVWGVRQGCAGAVGVGVGAVAAHAPRERWPSCRAPIVGTKPTDLRSSNAFWRQAR